MEKRLFVFVFTFVLFFSLDSFSGYAETPNSPVWKYNLGEYEHAGRYYFLTVDSSNTVYVPKLYSIYAINSDGSLKWKHSFDSSSLGYVLGTLSLSPDESRLYAVVGGYNGKLVSIDAKTGSLLWKAFLVNAYMPTMFVNSPAVSRDGSKVYVSFLTPGGGRFLGFNADTGEKIEGEGISLNAAAYGRSQVSYADNLYLGTYDGSLYSIYPYDYITKYAKKGYTLKDTIRYSADPSPCLIGGLSILGPVIDYKDMRVIGVDRGDCSVKYDIPAVVSFNLGDGTVMWKKHIEQIGDSIPSIDKYGNIYVVVNTWGGSNKLVSLDKDGNVRWETQFNGEDVSGVTSAQVKNDVVYVGLNNLYAISAKDGSILWKYSINSSTQYQYGSVPEITKDGKRLYIVSREGTLYAFNLDKQTPKCELGIYCSSKPKHNPVILIHGLGGKYTDWTTGNKRKVREEILKKYREDDPEYPDRWVVAYHYGYDKNGKYNYQGDIRRIALGLQELVGYLSEESSMVGGSGKVDIVAFSMGGLVAREYLASMVDDPEDKRDDRPHKISKAVIIGTPNKGAYLASVPEKVPSIFASLAASSINDFLKTQTDNGQPINVNSVAIRQISPGSDFLKRLAERPATDVKYYLLFGDIRSTFRQDLFGVELGHTVSIGDSLVSSSSASDIPGVVSEQLYPFGEESQLSIKLRVQEIHASLEIDPFDFLHNLKYTHRSMLKQSDVRNTVLNVLSGD